MNHILRMIGSKSKGILGGIRILGGSRIAGVRRAAVARGISFTNVSAISTHSTRSNNIPHLFRNYSSAALTQDQIKHRLLSLLSSFPKATTSSTTDQLSASFTKDLGLDSLDVVEVVMAAEEEFGVEVPDGVADGITCMGDLMKYLEEKLIEK